MALELDDLLVREYDLRTRQTFFSGHAPELQKYCTFKEDPLEIVHPDDRERVAAAWARAVASGSRYDAEMRYVRPDGSTVFRQDGISVPAGWSTSTPMCSPSRGYATRSPR